MKNIPFVAEFYDRYRSPYPPQLYRKLQFLCPPPTCTDVLDVGCGPGLATLELAKHYDQVTGLDSSEEMIRYAESTMNCHNVRWICKEAEKLPFPNDSFDLVTCGEAFQWFHFEDFLGEARRILRQNGPIALFWPFRFTTNRDKSYEHVLFQTYKAFLKKEGISDLQGIIPNKEGKRPEEAVVDFLTDSGFSGCEISYIEYSIQWTMLSLIGYMLTHAAIGSLNKGQLEQLKQEYRVRLTEIGFQDGYASQAKVLLITGTAKAKQMFA